MMRFPTDQTRHLREEDHAQDQHRSPPSTVLIVNISNSTLVNCVIGDSHPAVRQPLMQESHLQKADLSCSCCHSRQAAASATLAEAPHPHAHLNINIHGSCLNSVIVGDNNCMHVPDGEPFDWKPTESLLSLYLSHTQQCCRMELVSVLLPIFSLTSWGGWSCGRWICQTEVLWKKYCTNKSIKGSLQIIPPRKCWVLRNPGNSQGDV